MQYASTLGDTDTAADPLIRAALQIAGSHGVGAVSSRGVGQLAGISASAVNYRYGSLGDLMAAAGMAGDAARARAWQAATDAVYGLSLGPADFGPAAFSVLRRLAVDFRGEEALFWHEVIERCRTRGRLDTIQGAQAEASYWTELISRCNITALRPETMQAFALGLRFAWLVFEKPEDFDPWALALVMRFAARASGKAPATAEDSAWRRRAEVYADLKPAHAIPAHETAGRIIEAAIGLIMRQGAEAVTHRAIASYAKLSVSSVQHFFGTRRAILLAAFRRIFDSARRRALPPELPVAALDAGEFFAFLTQGRAVSPAENEAEFAAMHGLILSASHHDDTRPIAQALIARMGATSMELLGALKHPRGTVSRLDAQILSMTLGQTATLSLMSRTHLGADAPGGDPFADFGNHLLEVLFS